MIELGAIARIGAEVVAVIILTAGVLQGLIQLGELGAAASVFARKPPVRKGSVVWRRVAHAAPPISIVAPAFNEEQTVVESVRSLLALNYPALEVIVVNDGSSDATVQVLKDAFALEPGEVPGDDRLPHQPLRQVLFSRADPRLVLVDKENGGKADALNAGLNVAGSPLVCAIDADSLLEPDALLRSVEPFIQDPERTVAAGGAIRLANGCSVRSGRVVAIAAPGSLLGLIQSVEYLRAFLLARMAWSQVNALTIVSGAFGLFRRDALIEIGGYRTDTVGEDMEIIVRLHRRMREAKRDYVVTFTPEPICWTEAPEDVRTLGRQRARWQRGALQTLQRHRGMLFNPRYGAVGMFAFPSMLMVDVLGPLLEVAGYVLLPIFHLLGLLSWEYLAAFVAATAGFGLVMSVGGLALEEVELRRYPRATDLLKLLGAAVLENFGYRQMHNVWRLRGWLQFLRREQGWGRMPRRGFSTAQT